MTKSHGETLFFQHRKVRGIVKFGDRQMGSRRLKILTDGDDVALDCSKFTHDFTSFLKRLPIPRINPDFVLTP